MVWNPFKSPAPAIDEPSTDEFGDPWPTTNDEYQRLARKRVDKRLSGAETSYQIADEIARGYAFSGGAHGCAVVGDDNRTIVREGLLKLVRAILSEERERQ